MKWYLRSCPVCTGDLHDDLEDNGWVTCFMCARSFSASVVLDQEGVEGGERVTVGHPDLAPAA